MEHVLDLDPEVVFLTETWLESDSNSVTAEIKTYGYQLLHDRRKDRDKERGGGVGIMVKLKRIVKQQHVKHYTSFEHTIVKLSQKNNRTMFLITVYRLHSVSLSIFMDELAELFDLYAVPNDSFIIAGDINIHVETESLYSTRFNDMLDLYDLRQHIQEPTHRKGHTLDVVITPNKDSYLSKVNITETDVSDHFLVDFNVACEPDSREMKTITYRSTKNVDLEKFRQEVKERLEALPPTNSVLTKVNGYNAVLSGLIEDCAPLKTKKIKLVPEAPWFDNEYAELRKIRRKAEKRYRKSRNETDKKVYLACKKETINTSFSKKKSYVSDKLKSGSSKTLYAVVNQLIDNNKKEVVLPKSSSEKELADKFLVYFKEKIEKIRASFTPVSGATGIPPGDSYSGELLYAFEPTTEEEIKEIIATHKIKCSPEDPVPVGLLSDNIDVFIPYWVEIVNLSLEFGDMDGLKLAILLPLIKELSSLIDTENFKNYRPVSNLLIVSKLVEWVVQIRLERHMIRNKLMSVKNYGYKKGHSTKLLLLKVVDDLYKSFDKSIPTVVILLDLSAAFDTVDHKKLLEILEKEIGIRGTALKWFESFITNRTQKVKIGETFSDVVELLFGVPQGSVLGPILFKIYIRSLYKYVKPTKFEIEGFADDHQLYKQFLVSMQRQALGESINDCLKHLAVWMNTHFLRLNQTKTKILVIAPPSILKEILIKGVFLEGICIRFVDSAKNLGIILDETLSFESQVNKVVKSSYVTIKKLHQIKGFLSEDQLKQIVCSYVLMNLDYCNSLYYKMNSHLLDKLQRVQNCAARLISKQTIRSGGLEEKMMEFHWLRVRHRILYKMMLIVHNCVNHKAPEEIMSMINYADSARTMKLQETGFSNKYGEKAFSHSGPKLWNLLPKKMRENSDTDNFKTSLKSFLMVSGDEFCRKINCR